MSEETFLYLTTIGNKTGNKHRIEIWYVVIGSHYYLVSEHREKAHWVRNILTNQHVRFSIGTRTDNESTLPLTEGHAKLITPDEHPELTATVSAKMATKYDWSDGLIVEITATS